MNYVRSILHSISIPKILKQIIHPTVRRHIAEANRLFILGLETTWNLRDRYYVHTTILLLNGRKILFSPTKELVLNVLFS
jgi:hypothetical protein